MNVVMPHLSGESEVEAIFLLSLLFLQARKIMRTEDRDSDQKNLSLHRNDWDWPTSLLLSSEIHPHIHPGDHASHGLGIISFSVILTMKQVFLLAPFCI